MDTNPYLYTLQNERRNAILKIRSWVDFLFQAAWDWQGGF